MAGGAWERQRNTEHEVQGGGCPMRGLLGWRSSASLVGLLASVQTLGAWALSPPNSSSSHGRTLKKCTFSQAASHPLSQQGPPAQLPQESCLGVFSG